MHHNNSRRIIGLLYAQSNSIDISGPLQVFDTASRLLAESGATSSPAYIVETVSKTLLPAQLTGGLNVIPHYDFSTMPQADTLIVPGGIAARLSANDTEITDWVRKTSAQVRRIASTCTGVFILAQAGLLKNRRATTHWQHAQSLADSFPDINVDADAIFIRDDNIYTSAGVTAGMDLALSLVEEDWGNALALQVARQIVVFLKRSGGQSQFSTLLQIQSHGNSKIHHIQEWILEHLHEDLSVQRLAEHAAISPRHFSRLFKQETQKTVGDFIVRARLDTARSLLESSTLSIKAIAQQVGFGHSETMRRLFSQHFNTSPSDYRHHFSSQSLFERL
ncbi:MAG: transcriptional regulator GlxA family with amidase domain [Kiritimatiellia bacterium]|jgi:transcriptional regulator GlxA family with amidase domain